MKTSIAGLAASLMVSASLAQIEPAILGADGEVNARDTRLAESLTVPSLICSSSLSARPELDLNGKTLTVSSGSVRMATDFSITNGTLTTGGGVPLALTGNGFINAGLQGTGGLVVSGNGTIRLAGGENRLRGDYVIEAGSLRCSGDEKIPDDVLVRVFERGVLLAAGMESLAGLAGSGEVLFPNANGSMVMLGRCVATANRLVMGVGGELRPGDLSAAPAVGTLRFWTRKGEPAQDSPEYAKADDLARRGHGLILRPGALEIEDGTLFIDLAGDDSHDVLALNAANKVARVNGGILRVNLLEGYKPAPGTQWTIIAGTLPAEGRGFEKIEDATGRGYQYSAAPEENNWVLRVVQAP